MRMSLRKYAKRILAPLLQRKHFHKVGGMYVLKNPPSYLKAYYEYCTKLMLETQSYSSSKKLYLITVEFAGIIPKRDSFVLLQYEHTIVAQSYIPKNAEIVSAIKHGEYAELFQARLLGTRKNYRKAAGIIEYSYLNILHVKNSEFRDLYQDKTVYIAPVFVEFSPTWNFENGNRGCVTAFGDTKFERRAEFLASLRTLKINTRNVSGNYDNYYALFDDNSLLVNIHQTELHSTLEELRVLPALACGLLVISEKSPYQDNLIFRDFIEFAKIDEIKSLLAEYSVLSDEELGKNFPRDKMGEIYCELQDNNRQEMSKLQVGIFGTKARI